MNTNPPPGWYPHPHDATQEAYWDGNQWTGEVRQPQQAHDEPAAQAATTSTGATTGASTSDGATTGASMSDGAASGAAMSGAAMSGAAMSGAAVASGPASGDPLPLAGAGKRFGGFILDFLILSAILGVGFGIATSLGVSSIAAVFQGEGGGGGFILSVLVWVAVLVAAFLYEPLLHGLYGKTVGKMVVGTRLVDAATGEHAGHAPAWGRHFSEVGAIATLVAPAALIPVIGVLIPPVVVYGWLLWDDRKQALYDKMARTVVVAD